MPCVLTNAPCFVAHEDRDAALFVEPGDPRAMAAALARIATDPLLRSRLRRQGLQLAGRYTQDAHGRQLERVLAEVAGLLTVARS